MLDSICETEKPELESRDYTPRCPDYDQDCEDVPCKVTCWLYIPDGYCPYLVKAAGGD